MKLKITYEIDAIEEREDLMNLLYCGQMSSAIWDALMLIRNRLKHSEDDISDKEIRFLEELADTLSLPNIEW